jgi:tRNA-specific adenosine deaminase 2
MQACDHYKFMMVAIEYGDVALKNEEVPVTAILVHNETKEILYKAHNMTNITLNGTAHAEFEIYKYLKEKHQESHLQIWQNSTLYVTVEPCIMCASMLDQIGISMVVFGCPNERFGGNGSVFDIRYKSNYQIVPGVCHREAIGLLRKFYINENDRSPTTINKKKRTLKLEVFPHPVYSQFLTLDEFVSIWGEEHESIYKENKFLDFSDDGLLLSQREEQKRAKH